MSDSMMGPSYSYADELATPSELGITHDGSAEGMCVGLCVGRDEGADVGSLVGDEVGTAEGTQVVEGSGVG